MTMGFALSGVLAVDLSGAFLCLLFTPDGTTNLEEYVPEEMSTAAEGVLGHVHAEVLGIVGTGLSLFPGFLEAGSLHPILLTPVVVLFAFPSG